MALSRRIVIIALLVVVIALVGLGSLTPEETPEITVEKPDYNVTLGYIATTQTYLPKDEFLVRLAESEINQYCMENGIHWRFKVDVKCAEGQAQNAHDFTADFAEQGVKLVGGYGWSSFLCSGDKRLHFGLGAEPRVDSVEVRWSSGRRQLFVDLPVDRYLLIEEGRPDWREERR